MDVKDINKCHYCGLIDDLVECGGIYYCPNPFCDGSGSTAWKTNNLDGLIKHNDCIELSNESYKDWLIKGTQEIDKMPYALGKKIMELDKTKAMIEELKKVV